MSRASLLNEFPSGTGAIEASNVRDLVDATWLFAGAYNSGTAYTINDVVTQGGSTYLCIAPCTGQAPPNATYWTAVGQANVTATVAIGNGGTGETTAAAALTNLGALAVTATVAIGNGGTGATTASAALTNLGALAATATVAISNGGTGATTAAAALTNLGALALAGGTMSGNIAMGGSNISGGGTATFTTFVGALTGHASSDLALAGGTMSGNIAMGGSNISGGGTATFTTFVGALTGHASSDLALAGGTMTGQIILAAPQAPYTYLIAQNAGGTVYTAYDAYGNIVATNSTPDIVPILNTLLADLVTAGQGGKILIKSGSYKVVGTWTADPNNSSYYYLIGVPVAGTSANTMSITIEGECGGGAGQIYTYFSLSGMGGNALNNVGVQFVTNQSSTALSGTNGNSVFYVLKSSTGYAGENFISIQMNNVRWTQQTNQWTSTNNWFTMVDTTYASGFSGGGSLVVDTATTNSAVMAQPNSYNSFGIRFPGSSNQGFNHFDMINIAGYGIGALVQDHVNINYLYVQACNAGLQPGSGSHSADIFVFNCQECRYWIYLAGGQSSLNIWNLDPEPETTTGSNSWQTFQGAFANTGYPFQGLINIQFGPPGPNGIFTNAGNPSLGTMPALSYSNGGHTYLSSYELRFIGVKTTALAGTTAGTFTWSMPEMGSNDKRFRGDLAGYENTTGTAQTVAFTVPFNSTPKLLVDDSGGATVSTTTLTLPASMGSTKTGQIIVVGQ